MNYVDAPCLTHHGTNQCPLVYLYLLTAVGGYEAFIVLESTVAMEVASRFGLSRMVIEKTAKSRGLGMCLG